MNIFTKPPYQQKLYFSMDLPTSSPGVGTWARTSRTYQPYRVQITPYTSSTPSNFTAGSYSTCSTMRSFTESFSSSTPILIREKESRISGISISFSSWPLAKFSYRRRSQGRGRLALNSFTERSRSCHLLIYSAKNLLPLQRSYAVLRYIFNVLITGKPRTST